MTTITSEIFRNDFVQVLMKFSKGKISEDEANNIANKKLKNLIK